MTTPVVVVHYGAPEWCARTVDRLLASGDVHLQVLVVDNSGDLDASWLPQGVEVVRPASNGGYAGGANLGIQHLLARADRPPDHVVVCCHDVDLEPRTLAAMEDALASDPSLGVVGPRLSSPTPSAGGTWNGWAAHERPPTPADPPLVEVDWVSGACLGIRVGCLLEVGGFDAGFGAEQVEGVQGEVFELQHQGVGPGEDPASPPRLRPQPDRCQLGEPSWRPATPCCSWPSATASPPLGARRAATPGGRSEVPWAGWRSITGASGAGWPGSTRRTTSEP